MTPSCAGPAPPSSWEPDRAAAARHWRLYAAVNGFDPVAWELERQAQPALAEELAQNGPEQTAAPLEAEPR